ncbi:S8 family serine peptidase [Microbacterium resistens]|uniref:S8 family serine peptidase n=1 Tax=Microbacterium resistens TaxID=156977 RepID=UPI00366C236D
MRRSPGTFVAALLVAGAIVVGSVPASASAAAPVRAAAPVMAAGDACRPGEVVLTPQTPPALLALGAEQVAERATGRGVTVAVVDSGIDVANPHLADAVAGGVNLVGDGERPDGLSDPHGHGTAIAGEIAARRIAGSGVVGLAPDAVLLSVRVFRSDSEEDRDKGFGPTPERIAAGIRWAADNGARVINVSMSMQQDAPELRAAVEYADAVGALVVASAGNRAATPDAPDDVRYPAGYPQALGVTAAAANGRATDDSVHGPQVDVSAPGSHVLSTATGAGDCQFSDDAPSASFATGYASAAAALVAQAHPSEPPSAWAYRLAATAVRTDPDRRDDRDGWGFIRPLAAIDLLPDASTRGPASPFFDTGGSAVRPEPAEIGSAPTATPFALTREVALLVGVVTAALLAVLAALLLLRRRPDTARPAAGRPTAGRPTGPDAASDAGPERAGPAAGPNAGPERAGSAGGLLERPPVSPF